MFEDDDYGNDWDSDDSHYDEYDDCHDYDGHEDYDDDFAGDY